MTDTDMHKPGWLDTRISLEKLIYVIFAAIGGFVLGFYMLTGRVSTLEDHDIQQNERFARVETSIQAQRSDTRDALRDISQDVKDLSNKIDQLKDQMISNSVGNRPDMKKWSK